MIATTSVGFLSGMREHFNRQGHEYLGLTGQDMEVNYLTSAGETVKKDFLDQPLRRYGGIRSYKLIKERMRLPFDSGLNETRATDISIQNLLVFLSAGELKKQFSMKQRKLGLSCRVIANARLGKLLSILLI